MKLVISSILIALVLSGCATSLKSTPTANSSTRSTSSVESSQTYIDSAEFPSKEQTLLLQAATGEVKLTVQQTLTLVAQYSQSANFQKFKDEYSFRLFKYLNINPEEPDVWRKANPAIAKGITNYVGSSNESMADEGISWQSLNKKMRDRVALDSEEQKFLDEILVALKHLPQVKGLVFRGQKMSAERFQSIPVGAVWEQPAFTSTSIDFTVAQSFGAGQRGFSRTGILIIKTKGGAPVSPLTFDEGFMGQPGRVGEYEVLLALGSQLFVTNKLEDASKNLYLVFAEER